jgi:hypothetical protein
VAVITRNEIAGNAALSISLSIVLFLIGTCYLVLLAIENWFYNLFADYVKETEDRLMCKREVRPLSHFAKDKGHVTNPFHPSFYFALVAVTLGNTFFIIISLNRFLDALSAGAVIILCKAIIFLLFFSVYLWFFHFIFKRWERIVYRRIIHPLQHLYDSVQKNGTAQP